MDKIKFQEKKSYKLFGKKIFEVDTQFERCDLENVRVFDPFIYLPVRFEDERKN